MQPAPRVAVVTGAASGIGRACAELLVTKGFRVAAFDVVPDGLAGALELVVDVADEADVQSAFDTVREQLGQVDVLVNNAGVGGGPTAGLCHETPIEVWDRVQAVNVRGPFLCSRAVLPDMIERGYGQIVTIASVNGLVALPGRCAYTASKGGALMFTRSLAVDYGKHGIRANAICPGTVRTPLTADRLDAGLWDVERLVPLGRVAAPDEIAEAVLLLASGRLDYMTGAAWVIDGGWTAI